MDRKIALKWARALESGRYQQTTGALREQFDDDESSFCCLGVLCNLHAEAHPEIAALETDPEEYLGHDSDLPQAVMKWADIKHTDGRFFNELGSILMPIKIDGFDETAASLVDLNDEHELDFVQIAKVIREHSDKL